MRFPRRLLFVLVHFPTETRETVPEALCPVLGRGDVLFLCSPRATMQRPALWCEAPDEADRDHFLDLPSDRFRRDRFRRENAPCRRES
jgi:hypothetical protein